MACLEVGVFELWKAAQSTGEILESGIPPYTAYRRPASSTRPMPGRPDNNLASRTLECMLKPAVRRRGRGAGRAALGQPPRPTSPLRRRSPRHSRRASGSQLLIARRGRDSGRRSTTSTKARSRVPRRAARRPSTASRRTSPRRPRAVLLRCSAFLHQRAAASGAALRRRDAAAASSPRTCSSRPCHAQAGFTTRD